MTTTSNKRSDQLAADQAMIDGVTKFLMSIASLPVGSQVMTPAGIIQVFQDRITSGKAAIAAEAARVAAVKADKDERAKTSAFVRAFRRIVLGMFSESPDTLAVFKLKAPKAGKKTVQVKAEALAKGKATRSARHTMGSKQKKGVKGGTDPTANSGSAPAPASPTKPTA